LPVNSCMVQLSMVEWCRCVIGMQYTVTSVVAHSSRGSAPAQHYTAFGFIRPSDRPRTKTKWPCRSSCIHMFKLLQIQFKLRVLHIMNSGEGLWIKQAFKMKALICGKPKTRVYHDHESTIAPFSSPFLTTTKKPQGCINCTPAIWDNGGI
jgi:hypothetical protein